MMMRHFRLWLCAGLLIVLTACGSNSSDHPAASDVADGDTADDSENAADGDSDLDSEADSDSDSEGDSESADPIRALYGDLKAATALHVHEALGVATHMDQGTADNADRDFELATYKSLGGWRVREDFSWGSIEPTKGEWHFEGLDAQNALLKANGVSMIALLDYGVGWAMPDGTPNSMDPADFAAFAGKVAEHFCADIKSYEVWNEENIERFWSPAPDPAHYGALLMAAYTAIKQACPDANVLFGGLCSMQLDAYLGQRWWFLDEMVTAHPDICSSFDVLALHPYTYLQASSPEQDYALSDDYPLQSQTEMSRLAREKLAKLGCADKPIWYTEMGWPSYDLSEDTVARFLARSVLIAQRDLVNGYYWYDFYDGEPITTGSRPHENYFGLFGWPGDTTTPRREKPAFKALSALNARLGSAFFARDLSGLLALPNDVYALAFIDADKRVTLALWDGRENPDGEVGDGQTNNAETTYALSLPLPSWATSLTRYDQDGTTLETLAGASPLALTLTAKVQYLALGTSP